MEWKEASLRVALGKTLLELGGKVPNMLVINADLRASVQTTFFMNEYPERTVEVGIAEQNMIGVATGLAMMGYIPFAVTFARFASKRAADQISLCVDYCKTNVRVIGAYAGIFTGAQGATQQMISDTASMRSMPNMTVIDTADVHEIRAVLHYAVEHQGPLYIRIGRDSWPVIFDETYEFKLGKGAWLREGSDVTAVAIAGSVPHALSAAEELEADGISVEVIDPRTLVPLDKATILASVEKTGRLVIADPAHKVCSAASEIASIVAEEGFWSLQAPIAKVASEQVHIPYSPALEKLVYPTKEKIADAVKRTLE